MFVGPWAVLNGPFAQKIHNKWLPFGNILFILANKTKIYYHNTY